MIILDVIFIFIIMFAENVNCVYTVLTGRHGKYPGKYIPLKTPLLPYESGV